MPNQYSKIKKSVKQSKASDAIANDAFTNALARLGHGTPSVAEGVDYELVRWSNDYWLMITLFRNHWISRRIVEKPAEDMTKAWAKLQCNMDPDDISSFDRTIRRTFTVQRIKKAIKWARLFGGAGALIVIDGHEDILDKPLELDDVTPGSYKGLIVFDRWSGITPSIEIATDINSPVDFNLPEYYDVHGESGETFRVHHSRILRFIGPEVPIPENQSQMHWGISELEIAYEEIKKRDNASWSILSLMFRAQILSQVNPELASLISGLGASKGAMQKYQQVMQAQNELMSNQSMLVMGKDSSLQSHQYSFGGISDVYQQFQMDIAGAAKIPVSILFGRTVTGIGQSNDADIRIYEQEIAQKQEDELRPQLDKLFPVICMSEIGEVPDDFDFVFPSIRVLTEEEKSKLALDGTTAIMMPFSAGVTSQKTTLQELKSLAENTSIFTNITDKEIAEADDLPQIPIEVEQAEARSGEQEFAPEGKQEESTKKKSAAKDSKPDNVGTSDGLLEWILNKINMWKIGD